MISKSAPIIQIVVVGVRHQDPRLFCTVRLRDDQARVRCSFGAHIPTTQPRRIPRKRVSSVLDGFLLRYYRSEKINMFPALLQAQEASVHDHVMIIHEHRALREREHISHVVDGVILRFSFRIGFQRFFESLADARVDLFVLVIGTCCRQPQASVEPHRFRTCFSYDRIMICAWRAASAAPCARMAKIPVRLEQPARPV